MTVTRDPLTLHGVIEAAKDQAGSWALGADILGKSEKWLRDASNPNLEGRHAPVFTYDHARQMTRAGVPAFLDDLARLSGGKMVHVPEANAVSCMMSAVGLLGKESGEAMSKIAEAMSDGVITPNEKTEMRRELLDVQSRVTAILRMLEDGRS